MKKLANYTKYFYIIGALFIGCLFFYITYKTPLAGDDWGYALNGMSGNPIDLAVSFYNSWSGRFFSELWGFMVAPNKWIWNIVNPLLFVVIFLCIYYFSRSKKYYITTVLLIIAVILSVDDNLRMETYTWLMGTTYVIPLALSMIYLVSIDYLFFGTFRMQNKDKIIAILNNLLLFYIGLTMENIAATMIVAIVLLLIYSYFNKREMIKYLIVNLIVMSTSFIIMRMSPGSTARLLRDSLEWSKLSIIEKLINGYPGFIEFTFINNNYFILFLSVVISLLTISTKNKVNIIFKCVSVLIQIMGIITVFSFVLPIDNNFMMDSKSLFSSIFWIIYTVDIMIVLYFGLNDKNRDKALFFFMLSGTANLVMMYSPIFGSRSSIYTIFFMIVTMVIVLNNIDVNKYLLFGLFVISLFVCVDRFIEYRFKYTLVGLKQNERLEIIKYYKDHPEVEEAWIPRFPIYTVHGGDIEPGDTYHFETFREFYNLPQAADKIFFMYEED